MFVGPPGCGKNEDADAFSDALGCAKTDRLAVKADGASIKIEQIRDLQKFTRYGPNNGKYQTIVVESAEDMTPDAGGAFLKTLEEPPEGVIFILLVEREDKILKTIVSRCQKILFGEKVVSWQANPENIRYYQVIRSIGSCSIKDIFSLSAELEKGKTKLEETLYDLAQFSFCELKNIKVAAKFLEASKNIKRRANIRLSLDTALLKMREVCQNN